MTDTERAPRPPDLTRRTLTPFGYAVCFAVPILIAAVGFTFLHFHYDKEQLVRGTKLPILTSEGKPGDQAQTEVVIGQLTYGDDRCVRLTTSEGSVVDVVWPADYEAAVEASQQGPRVSIYRPDREVVARNTDRHLQLTGGYADVGAYAGKPCAPSAGTQVFLVESEPKAVNAG